MKTALLCLGVVLCAGGPAAAQRVRDSAGIRIVESSQPAVAANRMWRLAPQPVLQIGSTDGDSVYEFLRIMGVTRLRDGRIAVANQGTNTIRFFDAQGKYLSAFGRSGEGPGEFLQILNFRVFAGDSFAVADVNRVNYYSAQGEYARTIAFVAPPRPRIYVMAFLTDGSYLGLPSRPGSRTEPQGGRWVDSVTLMRVGPGPSMLDTLGRFPGTLVSYGASARSPMPVVFGPRFRLAVGAETHYVGFPERYEILAVSSSGALKQIIRRSGARRETPSAAIAQHREWMINRPGEDGRPAPPEMREYWSKLARETEFSAELPAYSALLVDRTGHLWVRQYDPEEEMYRPGPISVRTFAKALPWDVFDPGGAWLGRIELPANFTPLEIGADYLAGVWRDADEVEYVRFYRLIKPESDRP